MANGKDLIKALRTGAVPKDGFEEFFVGHDDILSELTQELKDIKSANSSSIRFIQGDYGAGKTMLASYIADKALSMNFCVSQIVITPMVQLSNFTQVYNSFCNNLHTPQSRDGSGLVGVLEAWAQQQFRVYKSIEGISGAHLDKEHINAYTYYIIKELVDVRNVNSALARGIGAFAGARLSKNNELAKYALDWIRGNDKITTKDYSVQLGLKGKINGDDAYNFMKGIQLIAKESGYAGTVVVLDEVETVRRLPQKNLRHKAYEVLRNIVDDCAAGKFLNSLFLVTGTSSFFNERTGIREYEALNARIKHLEDDYSKNSNKQPILTLLPMMISDLQSLAAKIRVLHGEAENWDIMKRVSDDELVALTEYLATSAMGGVESEPRNFIRKVIEKFDQLQAQPQKLVKDFFPDKGEIDG